MTAHWIAKDEKTCSLELKAALIAFSRIRGSHTGEHLAQTVLRLLDRVDITAKVRVWLILLAFIRNNIGNF